jgi:hypothetical protein
MKVQVLFENEEICDALVEYLRNQGVNLKDKETEVLIERGYEDGRGSAVTYTAKIIISDKTTETEPVPAVTADNLFRENQA